MLQSIIVGFGRSGQYLHLPCIKKAAFSAENKQLFKQNILIVDPFIEKNNCIEPLPLYRSIYELVKCNPNVIKDSVLHICTPPNQHVPTIMEGVNLGFKNIIVEKPLTTNIKELNKLIEYSEDKDINIVIIANWLSSSLTYKIKDHIDNGLYGNVREILLEQDKPRFSRSINNTSHTNAFEVETPHQLALACYLLGVNTKIVHSKIYDMNIDQKKLVGMGGAEITLQHPSGSLCFIKSNLTSLVRKRMIKVSFDEYTIVGYYPSGSDDSYSKFMLFNKNHQLITSELIYDDSLSSCFLEYYTYFNDMKSKKPVSDMHFNKQVVAMLDQAKKLAIENLIIN
ncbi:Gfo/Idh/MocA family oxidoreductase [Bacillus cereus]